VLQPPGWTNAHRKESITAQVTHRCAQPSTETADLVALVLGAVVEVRQKQPYRLHHARHRIRRELELHGNVSATVGTHGQSITQRTRTAVREAVTADVLGTQHKSKVPNRACPSDAFLHGLSHTSPFSLAPCSARISCMSASRTYI
jgi:hypothetical protein